MDKTLKTVVFISNFFNHHQKPFSEALYARLGSGYYFIATEPMDEERKQLGWAMEQAPDYVVDSELLRAKPDFYQEIINCADVAIIGSAPEVLVRERIAANRLTVRYSERLLKRGFEPLKYPLRFIRWHRTNPRNKNTYVLCASAYTASDYAKFGLFQKRCYKWGYFPAVEKYDDIKSLISTKKAASILWCARMIDWKHPEIPVRIAKRLKEDGYSFTLNMIGNGVMEEQVSRQIAAEGVEDCVHMLGAMKPEQVREYMEQSEMFLFTSDRNEGWGAVLNESMNSACAVVASHAIGSVPFMLNNGENGLIYRDGDIDDLYCRMKYLLDNPEERVRLGENAYRTIIETWNADEATERLLNLFQELLEHGLNAKGAADGPCSKAEIIPDDWM